MRWYVDMGGEPRGPYEEGQVLADLNRGKLSREARVCAEGSDTWETLRDVLPRFEHGGMQGMAGRSSGSAWTVVTTFLVIVVAGLSGVLIWRAFQLESVLNQQSEQLAGLDARLVAIGDQARDATGSGAWREPKAVHHSCDKNNTTVTCTFTNLAKVPVHTCMRGGLVRKGEQAKKLESVVLCSGRLDPAETRVITVPWVGGVADSICSRETAYQVKKLDWETCRFTMDPVNLADLRASAAPATR